MNVTIKDIARELGICYSSVSRALNGKPGVSEETRKKISETAERMGYRPNELARGLVNRVSKTIGVIIPEILNPLFNEITTGILETANKNKYDVFLCISNWDRKKEAEYLQTFLEKRVDGVIIKSADDSPADNFDNLRLPLIGFENSSARDNFSFVEVDNVKGGYLAAKHLLDCGYRKIAFIGGKKNSFSHNDRYRGFLKAFEEKHISFNRSLTFTGEFNIDSGYKVAKEMFSQNNEVDAVFACNDVTALGVLKYLDQNNLKPADDVGVVGFDDISYSDLPMVDLTTIRQPKYLIGKIMMESLLEDIKKKKSGSDIISRKIVLEPELIERGTTKRNFLKIPPR